MKSNRKFHAFGQFVRSNHKQFSITKLFLFCGCLAAATVASAQEYLVKDINTAQETVGSTPSLFTQVGTNIFYFKANDGVHGVELWKSDGTTAGTAMVADITVGGGSADPSSLVNANGTLFFTATTTAAGRELWKSDGTAAGTVMVKDILPGAAASNPTNLVVFNNLVFFAATDGPHGIELWESDGTTNGTFMVRDLNVGSGSSAPGNLVAAGGTLFFTANGTVGIGTNLLSGLELWKTDGSSNGTVLVKDINVGTASSNPINLTASGGTLYFSANNGVNGIELWKSDGTTAGTVLVRDINPGLSASAPQNLTDVSGTLFFSAATSTNGIELWKSDGTAAGTVLVKDINPGATASVPQNFVNVNGTLFFTATNNASIGRELWMSDGTSIGTVLVKDIFQGANSSNPANLVNLNGTLLFSATDGTNGVELWTSDGTAAGTVMVSDIRTGSLSSSPQGLTVVGNVAVFSADDGVVGRELWKSDGTTAGTEMIANIRDITSGSNPANLVSLDDELLFIADDGVNGSGLWATDGTEDGTELISNPDPQVGSSNVNNLVLSGGTAFFTATGATNGTGLWKSDGTAVGTVLVKDIAAGSAGSAAFDLTDINGTLFFFANDQVHGVELWQSDGTDAGTVMITSGAGTNSLINPGQLVNVNGTAYFTLKNGTELWKSDGTTVGTALVLGGGGINIISSLTAFNSALFFSASNSATGLELWKSDTSGTALLKDIRPGSPGSQLSSLTVSGGALFFSANDGVHGLALWKSDGTSAGTVMVSAVLPVASSLANANGVLYFAGSTGGTNGAGVELWKSDGTTAGTVMVADINAGSGSSTPANIFSLGSVIYFAATDGVNGRELWQSDGTAAGTFMVGDITGDSTDSNPAGFAVVGDTLFFAAQDAATGRELWAYILNHAPVATNPIPDQEGVFGAAFNFTVPADSFEEDDAGQTLSYSASGVPPGITFDAGSQTFSGTFAAAGQFAVTVVATDDGSPLSLSATNTFVITVDQAAPQITWANPADIVYGTPLGGGQLNATANTSGTFVYSPAAGTVLNAGTGYVLSVTFQPDDTNDYTLANASVTLNVAKALLTATAANQSRSYGASNPTLTINFSGFVNGDSVGVIDVSPVAATSATATSPVGHYPITLTGGSDNNYALMLVNGTLTVGPAPLSITSANASKVYGTPNPVFTGIIVGTQNGDNLSLAFTCSATTTSPVGGYPIFPMLVDPDNKRGNYVVTTNVSFLTITPAALTATITAPPSGFVQSVNTNIAFTGTFTKSGVSDSYLAFWTFASDGQAPITVPGTVGDGTVSCTVAFAQPGIYAVSLTVTNESGPSATATNVNNDLPAYVVIYDPNGGFVTGGGWITSPAGAYLIEPSQTGKATLGINAKYLTGASVPTGQTQFRIQGADFDFRSTSYDWLVISGYKAQYHGSGTINGEGDYAFTLTALDGQVSGGGGTDRFRIKISDKQSGVVIYDNQSGAPDTTDPLTPVQGNVVIHNN